MAGDAYKELRMTGEDERLLRQRAWDWGHRDRSAGDTEGKPKKYYKRNLRDDAPAAIRQAYEDGFQNEPRPR